MIKSLFQWVWFLVIAATPIFGWFLVSCLLILLGFKILKIKEIPRSKIVIFLFAIFLLSLFLAPAVNKIFEDVLNKPLLIFVNILIYFGVSFLFLKYYFLLVGKKLWQFLLYLSTINVVFSLLIWGITNFQLEQKSVEIETPNGVEITQQSGLQTSKDIIQCGSVSQKILTQYNYQPTETEKEEVIKSLTCINQAFIKCSPSSLAINNTNQTINIAVKGQGKLGCNVSVQKFTGETMTCPLPSDYVAGLQKKFAVRNYDATIVTDLITNINAEISSGNKSGNCNVTK